MAAIQVRHFTYQDKHYYRLFNGESAIINNGGLDQYLADGQCLAEFVKSAAPRQTVWYVAVDHEVKQWAKRQFIQHTAFRRNDTENPFRFDLPEEFASVEALAAWRAEGDGLVFTDDDTYRYYRTDRTSEELDPLPLEVQVVELGEFTPCPDVSFPWFTDSPLAYNEPEELKHVFPCRANGETIKETLKGWCTQETTALGISAHYLDQAGCNVYFADKTSTSLGRFFSPIHADNLTALAIAVDERIEEAKAHVRSMAATAKCPYCHGSGLRMETAGVPELARDIIFEVHLLSGKKTAGVCDKIERMVERLGRLTEG